MKILVIEDNKDLAINIGDYLEARQHVLDFAQDGFSGMHLAVNNDYDVIILDLNLPGIDGLELCRKLRDEAKRDTPVLMLTARDTVANKLEGYAAGCDDYMVKPFSLLELEARIGALNKLFHRARNSEVIKVSDLEYWPETMTLMRAGRKITLKPTTLKILVELMRESHRVVKRPELEQKIWKDRPPNSDSLRAHIYAIRSAVDKDTPHKLLQTIHGVGYRLALEDAF